MTLRRPLAVTLGCLVALAGAEAGARPDDGRPRLILIRHGESVANQGGFFAGRGNVPLTALGRSQALAAGKSLPGVRIDRMYSSRLTRASTTAELFLAGLGQKGLTPIRVRALVERGFGFLRGMSKKAVIEQHGQAALDAWNMGWDDPIPDGPKEKGETLRATQLRVAPFLRGRVMRDLRAGRTVAVASHKDVIRAILGDLEQLSPAELTALEVPNATPIVYRLEPDGRLVRER